MYHGRHGEAVELVQYGAVPLNPVHLTCGVESIHQVLL